MSIWSQPIMHTLDLSPLIHVVDVPSFADILPPSIQCWKWQTWKQKKKRNRRTLVCLACTTLMPVSKVTSRASWWTRSGSFMQPSRPTPCWPQSVSQVNFCIQARCPLVSFVVAVVGFGRADPLISLSETQVAEFNPLFSLKYRWLLAFRRRYNPLISLKHRRLPSFTKENIIHKRQTKGTNPFQVV